MASRNAETKKNLEITFLVILIPFVWKALDFPYLALVIVGAALVAYVLILRVLWKYAQPRVGKFWASVACLLVAVLLFIVLLPPIRNKTNAPPTSSLRIEKAEPLPFKAGETPKMNIWIMNDSDHSIDIRCAFEAAIMTGFSDDDNRRATEDKLWTNLRNLFDRVQRNSGPSEGFTKPSLPPKVESTMTVNIETMPSDIALANRVLNAQQASDLQTVNSKTVVAFMFILAYRDDGVWHELESCNLTAGGPLVRCFIGHNGPARGVLNHWWD
jgi:hypothetical protein